MRKSLPAIVSILMLGVSPLAAEHWPQWRGPMLNGVSAEKNLPVRWSTTENVTWKLAVPERSGSTPIVWGDHVFLNVGEGSSLALWAVDRTNGAVRWKRPLGSGNRRMMKQQMSSPSPVTDGKSVWVMTGTGVLKSFDFAGKEMWSSRHPGRLRALRSAVGICLVATAVRGCTVRAGAARDAHRRSVVPASHRQSDRQDGMACVADDACTIRVARRVHDTGAAAASATRRRSSSLEATS